MEGGRGDDTAAGGDGNDTVRGEDGADFVTGGDGNDMLFGDLSPGYPPTGDDTVLGEAGDDIVFGGAGTDRVEGGAGTDILFEEEVTRFRLTDTLLEVDGLVVPQPSFESVHVTGSAGDDRIDLSAFALGPATLDGGAGTDTLDRGSGTDVGENGEDVVNIP
jgi:Ca2+-binding RTX toxin-like protein